MAVAIVFWGIELLIGLIYGLLKICCPTTHWRKLKYLTALLLLLTHGACIVIFWKFVACPTANTSTPSCVAGYIYNALYTLLTFYYFVPPTYNFIIRKPHGRETTNPLLTN